MTVPADNDTGRHILGSYS